MAILVVVFAAAGTYATPIAFIDGVTVALAVCATLAAFGAAVALAVPGRDRVVPPLLASTESRQTTG